MTRSKRQDTVVTIPNAHLQDVNELYGHRLTASDGDIGRLKDFYFDDKTWVVRYLVADTGLWLTGRLVLLSPHAFGAIDNDERAMHVELSKKQIENSPSIDSHRPVSRQYEVEYYRYYGLPFYWEGTSMWGMSSYPVMLPPFQDEKSHRQYHHRDDKHLRSTQEVTRYDVQAVDGAIGHLSGFLVDDRSWAIHNLVVETGHWYAGKKVLVSTERVERISYEESKVFVNLAMADIKTTDKDRVVKDGKQNAAANSHPG